jgi:very-short-patch-repair endonuclease
MVSKGCAQLLEILKTLYPGQRVVTEYYLGNGLYVDIYFPVLALMFEYDGEQHEKFSGFFHKSKMGFLKAKMRDRVKDQMCADQGFTLVRVNYDVELTPENITKLILEKLDVS